MTPREYLRRREAALHGSVRSEGRRLVDGLDQRLDLSRRVREHPWIGLGTGVLTGCMLGRLFAPASGARLARGALRRSLGFASAVLLGDVARTGAPPPGNGD